MLAPILGLAVTELSSTVLKTAAQAMAEAGSWALPYLATPP